MSEQNRKFGTGSLKAAFRQGHKELGQALKAFPDSIPIIEEPGQLNNPTNLEVHQQRVEEKQPSLIEQKQAELRTSYQAVEKSKEREIEK